MFKGASEGRTAILHHLKPEETVTILQESTDEEIISFLHLNQPQLVSTVIRSDLTATKETTVETKTLCRREN